MSKKKQSDQIKNYDAWNFLDARIRQLNANIIVYSPVFLAIVFILFIGPAIGKIIYHDAIPPEYFSLTRLIGISIFSLSGVIQIIRREVPGFIIPIRGKAAIVVGVIWTILFLILGIVFY